MPSSLRNKTISGIIWSLLQNVGGRGITFIATVILARLLTPEIFGLVGMLMVFIQVSQALVVAGFNQALIQKKDVNDEDYSSVFWINLTVCLLIYIVLYLGAPSIANFYKEPILTELTRVFSLVFVVNAFSYVQEAKLMKEMRFKTLTIIHIPSTVIGGAVSIVMAYLDYGVWSLIALQVVTRIAFVLQIWIYAKWKPLFTFNKAKAKRLFSFGGNLMAAQVINTIFKNIYLVIIGKFFSLTITGFYQNASNLVIYSAGTLSTAIKRVTFSAFSVIQDDDYRLKRNYKKAMQFILFWICPIFLISGVLATPLFRLIFTEKWVPAVPYYQLLCIVGVLWPLNTFSLDIINVKGHSNLTLKLEIAKKTLIAISLLGVILFYKNIWMIMIVQVVNSSFSFFINAYFSGRLINYPIYRLIKDLFPILALNIGTGLFLLTLVRVFINFSDFLQLLICFPLGWLFYLGGARLFRLSAFTETMHLLKKDNLKKGWSK